MRLVLISAALALSACGQTSSGTTYKLYRENLTAGGKSVHVASFDTADGAEYNRENCSIAAELFAKQPRVSVRYWCENK